jgi:opacity protein-like surface antigen
VGRIAVCGCLLAALILGLAQPASAQPASAQPASAQRDAGQLSVGYSFLANDDLAVNQRNLTWGFSVDTAFKLTNQLSLAGELNGHFRRGIKPSDSLDRVVPPLPTQDFQALSFNRPETGFCSPTLTSLDECSVGVQTISGVVGPRVYVPVGRARPFVHLMAGATRSLRKIDFFAHTSTNFTLQGGAGFDVDVSTNVALHIQGDYRRVFFGVPDLNNPGASLVSKDGADFNEVMVSAGVGFKLGKRQ